MATAGVGKESIAQVSHELPRIDARTVTRNGATHEQNTAKSGRRARQRLPETSAPTKPALLQLDQRGVAQLVRRERQAELNLFSRVPLAYKLAK